MSCPLCGCSNARQEQAIPETVDIDAELTVTVHPDKRVTWSPPHLDILRVVDDVGLARRRYTESAVERIKSLDRVLHAHSRRP